MIFGFEWIPEHDRQLQYNNKTYRNDYSGSGKRGIYGFEWTKDDDNQQQYAELPLYKTLISLQNEYKKYGSNGWETVATSLPSQTGFEEHGMDDLSVFDRSVQPVMNSPFPMVNNGALGEGKVFKGAVDLSKYLDLRKLEVK